MNSRQGADCVESVMNREKENDKVRKKRESGIM
jgi:hypothetical protein